MTKISIDSNICKRCGMCVQICPMEVFEQTEKGAVVNVAKGELCISCGQCLAVCPQKAHSHTEIERSRIVRVDKQILPEYSNVLELMKSRRSVRRFKDIPVEKEKIEQVIRTASFAPSAENFQSTKYLVVQDKAVISKVVELCIDFLKNKNNEIRNALNGEQADEVTDKALKNVDVILNAYNENKDRLAFNAPCLVFHYSKVGLSYSEVNANLAIQNAMLGAHSLGLGSFYTGYIVSCCQQDRSITKLLNIPEGYEIYGAMTLGYPKVKLMNLIERDEPQIMWN